MGKIRVVCDECGFEAIIDVLFSTDNKISFCSNCGEENILIDEVDDDENDWYITRNYYCMGCSIYYFEWCTYKTRIIWNSDEDGLSIIYNILRI